MTNLSAGFARQNHFRAVYVEQDAFSYEMTQRILSRLEGCPVITIRRYQDVFFRPNQDVRWQKEHLALILAVKRKKFVYPGPPICQHFGHQRFYSCNLMIGCPFDCSYCYLQGLYPSAFPVAFVNINDFAHALVDLASEPVYVALSHDSDLLSFNGLIPYLDLLFEQIDPKWPLIAEVRTKTANRHYFLHHEPISNVIFAFSLAPDEVISRYERRTPSLDARLEAIKTAQDRGFAVRLCFDPIIAEPELEAAYDAFFQKVFQKVDRTKVVDLSYGFFRMSDTLYRRIARLRPYCALYQNNGFSDDEIKTGSPDIRQVFLSRHLKMLYERVGPDRVFLS